MTLKEWFRIHHTRPLKIAAAFLLVVWFVFAARSFLIEENKQNVYVKQTADLLSIAVHQKNRILAESLLETLISQGGATSAEVCEGEQQVIGANRSLSGCHSHHDFLERVIEHSIPGSGSLVLKSRFNLVAGLSSLLFTLALCLIFVFLGFYFIQTAQSRLKKDLFDPLAESLLGSQSLEIKELSDLRKKVHEAHELEAQKVVTLAIQENNNQVAHDIRSPVEAINALFSMVEIRDVKLKAAIEKALARANSVANCLLKKERDSDSSESHFQYDLASVIQDIATEKSPIFKDGQIIVGCEGTLRLKTKLGADSLSRILSNLVDNAILACDKKKVVKISLQHNTFGFLEVIVEDSGRGIDGKALARLGQKGFSQRLKTEPAGSGRGVYSAKKALQEIGGELVFTSHVGIGTKAIIRLPAELDMPVHNVDLVLIDNEELHRTTWEIWADSENLKIKTFESAEKFIQESAIVNLNAIVFLDSDLGDGKRGQDYLGAIRQLGFKKVILTTGFLVDPALQIQFGIDGIMTKNPVGALKYFKENIQQEIG